jgi:hypothetical protein
MSWNNFVKFKVAPSSLVITSQGYYLANFPVMLYQIYRSRTPTSRPRVKEIDFNRLSSSRYLLLLVILP